MRLRHVFPAALVLCVVAAAVIVLYLSRSCESDAVSKRVESHVAHADRVVANRKGGASQSNDKSTAIVRHEGQAKEQVDIPEPQSETLEQERERLRVEAELEKIRREPLKGAAEQLLMMATPAARGDSIPPLPITYEMDEALEAEAEKMLERIVKVEEHDNIASLEVKEQLLALREEWLAAKEKGMRFVDFLRQREGHAQNDAEHYADAINLEREYYNDKTLNDEDYLEARKKINNLLNIEGFKPLPPLEEEEEDDATGATSNQ